MLREIKRAVEIINSLGYPLNIKNLDVDELEVSNLPIARFWRARTPDEFLEALDKLEAFDAILVGPDHFNKVLQITIENTVINKDFPYTIFGFNTIINMTNSQFVLSYGQTIMGLIIYSDIPPISSHVLGQGMVLPVVKNCIIANTSTSSNSYGVNMTGGVLKDCLVQAPVPAYITGPVKLLGNVFKINGQGPGIYASNLFAKGVVRIKGNSIYQVSNNSNVVGIQLLGLEVPIVEDNDIYDVTGTGVLIEGTSAYPSKSNIIFKNYVGPGSKNVTPTYGVRESGNVDSNIIVGNVLKATTPISTVSTTTVTDDNIT